ncbi:IPT/TIG domain-containing protein [Coprobacter tertius]|uniref:IPT/TIG domain-containing protein n=1 Tax=Coprobacter tertius TaxID=2944915 RepID=A0ABT1MGI5_9BACT|nr:IPT/TIG domain-containing protein [Coprobacter tertius]MCP9611743.1 IPT/TIG domain-containing protein [Coprobacter tertius]
MNTKDLLNKSSLWVTLLIMVAAFYACNDNDQAKNMKAGVTEYSPVTGGRSTLLTLNGYNFGTDINRVKVTINGKEALVKSVSNEIITAEVQKGMSSGLVRIILGERPDAQVLIYDTEFTYISNQLVSTFLGGKEEGETDGELSVATLSKPRYLIWGKDNALYIVEDGNAEINDMACIRRVKDNRLTTLLKASDSELVQRIRAIDFSLDGNTMYIVNDNDARGTMGFGTMTKNGEEYDNLISLSEQSGVTSVKVHPISGTVFMGYHSGSWIYKYDENTGFASMFQLPDDKGGIASKGNINSIVFDESGTTVYIVSRKNHVIYKAKYDLVTGNFSDVKLFAGSFGIKGYADGMGNDAKFSDPCQADIDQEGNLYVADRGNHCIRVITPEGDVSTYAGVYNKAGMVDGIASQAEFNNPEGLQFGPDDALYVADYSNYAIRKIEESSGQ